MASISLKKQGRRFKMKNKDLLGFKKNKKAKNPKFLRQDSYKKKRLSKSWRKPRGWDSKQRKRMQRQAIVEPGYGTPKSLKGADKNGLAIVMVSSVQEANKIKKEEIAVVSRKLGAKKKIEVIKVLMAKKASVLNIKDPASYIKKQEELIAKKKQEGEKKQKEEKETPQKKKDSIEDKLSDEDKKKLEKKEIDKLLTKKI